jgi:tRNA isopentenyl-2-thiomethyl-A-37 hydroxylase MiaE
LYLESYVAELIKFYSSYDESECRAFINFLDVLNVTLAIFDEDTNYSLIKMKNVENDFPDINLENYRVFSQSKQFAELVNQPSDRQDTTRTLNPLE